jgi:hypothetical protein
MLVIRIVVTVVLLVGGVTELVEARSAFTNFAGTWHIGELLGLLRRAIGGR